MCDMWERCQCWSLFEMWKVKWNPSLWRDLHDKRFAANPVWKTLTKIRRGKEGGREYIMHQFFKMAGHPLCLFTWWYPGCPHPSVGMLSIFQPSLINPETTPLLSFHLPIRPSQLHCLLPRSNCFHKHMPWILLSGSGVRGCRSFLNPFPSPCTPLLHLAPCIGHLLGLHFFVCMLSSLSIQPDHDHRHTVGLTVWKFRPLLTFTL